MSEQLFELPTTNEASDAPTPRSLREHIARQPAQDTGRRLQEFLQWLDGNGGHAFEAEAKRAGFGDDVLVAAVLDHPTDRRIKARALTDELSGEPVIWLSKSGWKAVGKPSKDATRPTTQTLAHADAPRHLRSWLKPRVGLLRQRYDDGVAVEVVTDPRTIAELSDVAKSRAWGKLQSRTSDDQGGGIGSLVNGFRPDAITIERWWSADLWRQAYRIPDDAPTPEPDALGEMVWAVEIENTQKGAHLLADKVAKQDAARTLGVISGTVWVVRTAGVARALAAFGIGLPTPGVLRRPGHYFVPSTALGLSGDSMGVPEPAWWPTTVVVPSGTP